eukprot:TRINITY_DN255_c0_g2_i1.p1 TRINITY_DN255_c0_g2~~TRINITY_DN255_c0_g2_i1.p1  ORF type:complete len:209 (+),score=31.24 TRINITY_DN255_c0_g2_i1:70-696(+)
MFLRSLRPQTLVRSLRSSSLIPNFSNPLSFPSQNSFPQLARLFSCSLFPRATNLFVKTTLPLQPTIFTRFLHLRYGAYPKKPSLSNLPMAVPEKPVEHKYFAVVLVGGRQYKVVKGDVIITHKLEVEVGEKIILQKVLLVAGQDFTAVGQPMLKSAAVHAEVEEQTLSRKVIIFKKKRRKGYQRKRGHRLPLTTLRITDIEFEYPVPK